MLAARLGLRSLSIQLSQRALPKSQVRAISITTMPPRKSRTSLPKANGVLEAVTGASSTSAALISTSAPHLANGTTLVEAIEHLPPQPPLPVPKPGSDDDLTPPPPAAPTETHQAVSEISNDRRRSRGKAGNYAEANGDHKEVAVDDDIPDTKVTSKRKGASKLSSAADEDHIPSDAEPVEELEVKTPKKGRKKKVSVPITPGDGEAEAEGAGDEAPAKEKKPRKPTPKKSRIAKDEPQFDEEGNEIVQKPKRKPKVYPKIEYDIPDVERKSTTFKGRLGYACLNTVLRSTKPDSIFCSRTCRIASIEEEGMELPKGLALMNVRDLKTMIEWNEQNKIRFMRLSSEMFPFASHAKYGYDLSFAAEELKEAGDLAIKYGHRLTMHPGQFTQLGSPKDAVVEASIRELDYQCEILDRMGLDQDSVMIIHMGGIYGDKPSTLERFKTNYQRLKPNVKARLVLENDELCYNVDDIMATCNELEIPIIFDYHHDWIYPSSKPPSEIIPLIAETWKKRGIRMKQHLSEPRPGAETVMEKRAHADRCKTLPADLPDDVDLMIEAKDKEQAVFELYRIYGLQDVIWDNLRPPDPAPSLATKGRKSSVKNRKTKDTGEVDADGKPVKLEDFEKEGDGGVGDEGSESMRIDEPDEEVKKEVKKRGKKGNAGKTEAGGGANGDDSTVKAEKRPVPTKKRGKLAVNGDGAPKATTDALENVGPEVKVDIVSSAEAMPKKRKVKQVAA